MTIQIPDDLARGLEGLAAERKMTVEQLALERLMALFNRPTSPDAVLSAIQALPHPSSSAVDDLEEAISAGRLPVREQSTFEK